MLCRSGLAIFVATTCLLFFINAKRATIFCCDGPLGLSAALQLFQVDILEKSFCLRITPNIWDLFACFYLRFTRLQNIMGTFSYKSITHLYSALPTVFCLLILRFSCKAPRPLFVRSNQRRMMRTNFLN